MILYSVTISIDNEIHDEWLDYVKNKHVPQVLDSGLVVENKILKLLTSQNPEQGTTYSFQYYVKNLEDYEKLDYHENDVYKSFPAKFRNKFFEFRTVLEVI